MMKTKKAGYLLLRKPEYNYDLLGRGAFLPFAPKVGDLYYGGIDRMQWFDVDEDFYSKTLPDNLVVIRSSIWNNSSEGCDIKLCQNLKEAKLLLEYCNGLNIRSEIVAIYSDRLVDEISSVEADVNEVPIGCDLYCEGYGSIIKEGIYATPELFAEFIKQLNENGIFENDNQVIDSYVDAYKRQSAMNNLEIFAGAISKVFLYRVEP